MLQNWIKLYFTIISKSRLFFLWNILGLAVGMASVILAIAYLKSEYSYNQWIPNEDQIYELNLEMGKQANSIVIPGGIGPYLSEQKLIDNYCYYGLEYLDFYGESRFQQGVIHKILNTQKTFFDFFPYSFKYGDPKTVFAKEYSIAISAALAHTYFGDVNPIGDTLALAHQKYVVSGVYELNHKATIMPDVVLPNIEWNTADESSLWQENAGGLIVRKEADVANTDLIKALESVYSDKKNQNKYHKVKGDDVRTKLLALKNTRFESKQTEHLEGKTNKVTLSFIVGCSLLFFLLTILNYINLNQAIVLSRAKEFYLRRIVGASRGDLIAQLLFEAVLNASIALSISLVIIELCLPTYNSFLNQQLLFTWTSFWSIIIFVVLAVVLLGGIVPALFASFIANQHNYKSLRLKHRSHLLRMSFVIVQLIIAFFFLIAGNIMYHQVDFMQQKERGFDGEDVYQIKLYSQQIKRKLYRTPKVVKEIKDITGVQNVSLSTLSFKRNAVNRNQTIYFKKQKITDFLIEGIDKTYLTMMGFEFVVTENDIDEDLPTVVVNQKFVAYLGLKSENVIGEVISFEGNTFIIRGIVKDFYRDGFEESIKPMLLFDWKDIDFLPYSIESVSIQIDPRVKEETLERLQAYWIVNMDYEYPFEAITVSDQFAKTYQQAVSQLNMFILWNVAVILIALFGLYAVLSFIIERKLKEIAIRKVLGASTVEITKLLLYPFLWAIAIAYSLVLYPSYWIMQNWLHYFAYKIEVTPRPFIASFIVLVAIISLILWIKIRKIIRGNILQHIKYE